MNKKNIIALGTSSILVLGLTVSFFNPFSSKFDIPGSYPVLKSNIDTIKDVHAEQIEVNDNINALKQTISDRTSEIDVVKENANVSQRSFSEILTSQEESGDWSYHLPSILIELETLADKNNVTLAVDYNSLKSDGSYVSSSEKGLKVVSSKVEVYGMYKDVTNYIKYIENIDFISLDSLVLDRVEDGDTVGTYNLSIYYME